jgi:TatA/E family protein of Tat protein translocase
MLGLGVPELLIILAIVLVIVGPGRLSGMGHALGASVRSFRAATREHAAPRSDEALAATRPPLPGSERTDQADPTVY